MPGTIVKALVVGCAMVLRGRGGDVISRAAGSGVLDPGDLAAKAKLSEEIDAGKVAPESTGDTGDAGRGHAPGFKAAVSLS